MGESLLKTTSTQAACSTAARPFAWRVAVPVCVLRLYMCGQSPSVEPVLPMNSQGRLVDRLDVELKVPGFHHDMFITENYMVLVDGSTRFTPEGVVKGQPLWNFDQARTGSRVADSC